MSDPVSERTELPIVEKASHDCTCGEHDEDIPELDARAIPHAIRHATVFGAFQAIPVGGSMILIAPHNPLPLLAQMDAMFGGVEKTYLLEEPQDFRIKLTKTA